MAEKDNEKCPVEKPAESGNSLRRADSVRVRCFEGNNVFGGK
jgi:hypothetical protein